MSELQIEKDAEWNPYENREALIERLQAENAELRKDAERYRWLRDAGYGFDIAVREEDGEGEQWVHGYPPEELDAAIDAAMKGGE